MRSGALSPFLIERPIMARSAIYSKPIFCILRLDLSRNEKVSRNGLIRAIDSAALAALRLSALNNV